MGAMGYEYPCGPKATQVCIPVEGLHNELISGQMDRTNCFRISQHSGPDIDRQFDVDRVVCGSHVGPYYRTHTNTFQRRRRNRRRSTRTHRKKRSSRRR